VGGAILNLGQLTINACTVSGNTASSGGGGIHNNGALTVTQSSVSANTGGGISIRLVSDNPNRSGITSSLTINNSTIANNIGYSGVVNNGSLGSISTCVINNSTISGNSNETGFSGGITNLASDGNSVATLTLNDSTISGNRSVGGGGGITNGAAGPAIATANITNSTISSF
jgi:hypothetical protein